MSKSENSNSRQTIDNIIKTATFKEKEEFMKGNILGYIGREIERMHNEAIKDIANTTKTDDNA